MSDRTSPPPAPPASGRGVIGAAPPASGRGALAGAPPVRGRGGKHDLTSGPIGRTLLAFALPTLGANILQSLNGSINTIWVGRFLGEGAVAATANANTIMFLMFAGIFGFGMAATILIGQSIGRRDIEGARRAFGASIGLVMGAAVVIAVLGWIFTPEILKVLATPPSVMPLALEYLRVIFLGLPATLLLVLLGMALRGVGDSITPLWFTVLSVVLDSGLNPVFIRGWFGMPAMGIAGSATATLISAHVAAFGLLAFIYLRDLPIRLRGHELTWLIPSPALIRTIIGKGLPMGAQMLVVSFAALTMTGLVNRYGVDTSAAYGVSMQLWGYIQMPALAVGAAVSSMVAQNIGAGLWDRVDRITRSGLLFSALLTSTMVAAVILFDRPVMAVFLGGDSPALPIARHIQVLASWNFIVFGMTMVLFSAVRANGAVWAPLVMLIIAMYPVRLGFALAFKGSLGADSLWWSFPLGSVATLLMSSVYYRYGGWRKQRLVVPASTAAAPTQAAAAEPVGGQHPVG
ncbi:MATE family efflux transporter [uncultured Sphingomonas sp.]|uniref:MATE family efflux transporter n=1 Tax=uncultured Sphingomonas sp. TaxID=158754 RepID=UPI0030F6E5BA